MKLIKYSGYYLVITGVLHSIIGCVLRWPTLMEMHNENWFSSGFLNNVPLFDRLSAIWFLSAGLMMIILGLTLQKALKEGFVPPLSLAWGILLIGLALVFLIPVSGAYLLIIQGFILLFGIPELASKKLTLQSS